MVHFFNILFVASVALLPAFAVPVESNANVLLAREPQPAPPKARPATTRPPVRRRRHRPANPSTPPAWRARRAPNPVNEGARKIRNAASHVGNVATSVSSAISSVSKGVRGIRRLFGREDELFVRGLLEELEARGYFDDDLEVREPEDLFGDELEAREFFYDELD